MSKKVVRVHFMDDSKKAFAIDSNASSDTLRQTVIDKLEIKEDSTFWLFEKKDDWERCLDGDEKPIELMKAWDAEKKKEDEECRFIFKKKIFLKDDEKELEDPVARDYVYKQALANIINSDYPVNVEDCLRLAGLQMQVVYGDHNSSTHVPGFLSANLKKFVPVNLFGSKKSSEWESIILKEHQNHRGKKQEEAKLEYINLVKQNPYYGTTFYPPCKSAGNKSIPSKVIIGVNYEGIRLFKVKNKELVSEHLFTEICSWASSSGTFAFEFGNQNESQKYTFETKQGAIIAATIQTYIDILVQMLKNGEEEDDESLSEASEGLDE